MVELKTYAINYFQLKGKDIALLLLSKIQIYLTKHIGWDKIYLKK